MKEAAPTVAAGLAPIVAALPIVDDAVAELTKANEVIRRHCWTRKTFLDRFKETRQAAADKLEALTAVMIEVAQTAGMTTAETGATTTVRVWSWVRSWF